jgi:hypothetical protein
MQKSSMGYTIDTLMEDIKDGLISFTYPIQREGGQWDATQKSLLIHSILANYPIPSLYALSEEIDGKLVLQILDGKQRLTNIRDFIEGKDYLVEDTPPVTIRGKKEILSGMVFDDLSKQAQKAIMSFSLDVCKLEGATDEEIEDMFYRLNNGTPLSKQQKAKAKMGRDWATKIQGLVKHDLITKKASFTPLQIRKADHETALLQTMMLIDPTHELKSISSNDVFAYSQTFKEDVENKEAIVKKLVDVMDYLDNAFESKESVLLKKVHFPMTMLTAMMAMERKLDPIKFRDWRTEFKKSLKATPEDLLSEDIIATDYKNFGGAGSVKKEKTLGRVNAMKEHLEKYVNKKVAGGSVKPVEEKKPSADTKAPVTEEKPVEAKKEEPKQQQQVKVEDKRKATTTAKKETAKKETPKPATTGKAKQVKKESSKEKSTTA